MLLSYATCKKFDLVHHFPPARVGSGHETKTIPKYTYCLNPDLAFVNKRRQRKLEVTFHSLGCKVCDDKCSEAQERDDQSNIDKILQDYNIHRRVGDNSEILGMYACMYVK